MSKDEKDQDKGAGEKDRRSFLFDSKGNIIESTEQQKEETEDKPDDVQAAQGEPDAKAPPEQEKQESGEQPEDVFCDETKDLPPMTFSTLIFSLSTQAMVSMGEFPDPMTKKIVKDLSLAKQSIDLLGILEEKTRGNLDNDEEQFLKASLTDLRIRFVEHCRKT